MVNINIFDMVFNTHWNFQHASNKVFNMHYRFQHILKFSTCFQHSFQHALQISTHTEIFNMLFQYAFNIVFNMHYRFQHMLKISTCFFNTARFSVACTLCKSCIQTGPIFNIVFNMLYRFQCNSIVAFTTYWKFWCCCIHCLFSVNECQQLVYTHTFPFIPTWH